MKHLNIVCVLRENCPECFETIEFEVWPNDTVLDERESRAFPAHRIMKVFPTTCSRCLARFEVYRPMGGEYRLHRIADDTKKLELMALISETYQTIKMNDIAVDPVRLFYDFMSQLPHFGRVPIPRFRVGNTIKAEGKRYKDKCPIVTLEGVITDIRFIFFEYDRLLGKWRYGVDFRKQVFDGTRYIAPETFHESDLIEGLKFEHVCQH